MSEGAGGGWGRKSVGRERVEGPKLPVLSRSRVGVNSNRNKL